MNRQQTLLNTCAIALLLVTTLSPASPDESNSSGQTLEWQDDGRSSMMGIDTADPSPQVWPVRPGDTDWRAYNKQLDGNRYADINAINPDNVDQLQEACRVVVSGGGPFSSGPVVVDNVLYTTAWRETLAIHPANCEIIWKSIYSPGEPEVYNANRGVAFLDGMLYRGTGDGRLVAYEAATGRELWRKKVGNPLGGEYISAAPIAWDGKVFIGLAGGDFGIVGRMMAFDAKTGAALWSFNTIPQPGEFGNDSWPGDTWKSGGGGTWASYTLDPATGELFVPVANPAPDFDAQVREGDNLFTNAVVVLDANTGSRNWHFQTRRNDNHDYGLASPPVLLEVGERQAVAQASKDGFLYLIDRNSHELIWKTAVTTILNHDADATREGVKVCPGAKGGVSYNSPGYDPERKLLIVGSVDWCYNLVSEDYPPHVPGSPYMGGRMEYADETGTGWITAVDAQTGEIVWRHQTPAPVVAAITPTAGGITFAGDTAGTLFVFRTDTGELLREINTGGALAGGIVTYQIHGQQYVAVNSGNTSRNSWGAVSGIPSQVIYRLPKPEQNGEKDFDQLEPNADQGRAVYRTSCIACHGPSGRGGEGPGLLGLSAKYTQDELTTYIVNPKSPMPALYPLTLNAQEVVDVAAYLLTLGAERDQ